MIGIGYSLPYLFCLERSDDMAGTELSGRLSKKEEARKVGVRKRPDIPDKESLIQYLEANPETELPFLEKVWEQAVIKAEENANTEPVMKENVEKDKNGNTRVVMRKSKILITDPVKQYFKLMGLKQNKDEALRLKFSDSNMDENKKEILEAYFDDDTSQNIYVDEVTSWIALFPPDEREYLKKRYASYYDNYEINDGADKVSLKRLLSVEIELYRMDIKRASGKGVVVNDEKRYTELFTSILESLKWTKKQRSAKDDIANNKFTIWMDSLVKEGGFQPNKKHYEKDEIDFLMETYVNSIREMLT